MSQKSSSSILILSESPALISEVGGILAEAKYKSIECIPSSSLENVLKASPKVHAIILDYRPQDPETLSLMTRLKQQSPRLPIIALVEQSCVEDAVQIIRQGARTAVEKPIHKDTLLLAIKDMIAEAATSQHTQSVIQKAIHLLQSLSIESISTEIAPPPRVIQSSVSHQEVLQVEDLSIDLIRQKAFYRNVFIDLTSSQFRLLTCLAESQGHIVPYEDLYFYLHNIQLDRTAARTALSAHLSYLRARLSDVGCDGYLINVRGRGYLLDNPVQTRTHDHEIEAEQVLQQLPIIIWTTDMQLRVTWVWGERLLRLDDSPIRLIGLSLSDFLHLDQHNHAILVSHRKALIGETSRYEHMMSNRLFHVYISPSTNHNNEIIGTIGLALDMADQTP